MITKKEYDFLKILLKSHLDALEFTGVKDSPYYKEKLKLHEKLIHLSKETKVD